MRILIMTQRTFTVVEYFTVVASSSEEAYSLHAMKSPAVEHVSTRVTEKAPEDILD
jgi:hypothetical protein